MCVCLQCDPGLGADAFYDFIYQKRQLIMLIGTRCSEVTKTLAEIVPYWNLLLVCQSQLSLISPRVGSDGGGVGVCPGLGNSLDTGKVHINGHFTMMSWCVPYHGRLAMY